MEAEAFLRGEDSGPLLFKLSDSEIGAFTRADEGVIVPEITAKADGLDLDLDGCFEKLSRAQEHLETINELLAAFFDSEPYGATSEVEQEHGWHVFRIKIRRQPPLRIGIVMGEYVHQVRSAFDHFAFALARAHLGRQPKSKVVFPVETSRTKYRKRAEYRLDGQVPDDWATFIKTLQPYDAHHDPLALLETFWNTDKHQVVVPIPAPSALWLFPRFYPHIGSLDRRTRTGVRLVDGAEFVRFLPGDPQPTMHVYCEAAVEIRAEGSPLMSRFFWSLLNAEEMLRFILSTFESGRRESPRTFLESSQYRTVFHSFPGGIPEVERLGRPHFPPPP